MVSGLRRWIAVENHGSFGCVWNALSLLVWCLDVQISFEQGGGTSNISWEGFYGFQTPTHQLLRRIWMPRIFVFLRKVIAGLASSLKGRWCVWYSSENGLFDWRRWWRFTCLTNTVSCLFYMAGEPASMTLPRWQNNNPTRFMWKNTKFKWQLIQLTELQAEGPKVEKKVETPTTWDPASPPKHPKHFMFGKCFCNLLVLLVAPYLSNT